MRKAFTLIELLVVIAIIAVLMSILMPSLNRAREQGRRIVCLSNLKQMSLAWNLYADDYNGKIVSGDTHAGVPGAWVHYEPSMDEDARILNVKTGALFPYVPKLKLYKCPIGLKGEICTYSIPDYMNGHIAIANATPNPLKSRNDIHHPTQQIVFLDEGKLTQSSFTIYHYKELWWDQVTSRHGDGTNFSFADGHGEYWKWKDPRTVEIGKTDLFDDNIQLSPSIDDPYWSEGNPDMHRVSKGCFDGKLGFTPTNQS